MDFTDKQDKLIAGENITISGNTISTQSSVAYSEISEETIEDADEEITIGNSSETEEYVKIGDYGVKAKAYLDMDGNSIGKSTYSDYELFTVGDSFAANNVWNAYAAELLGCKFDKDANIKPGQGISTGGTRTSGGSLDSTFFRCKNLYDQNIVTNDGEKAIILLENVNDINADLDGTIDDVPLVPKTPIEVDSTTFDATVLEGIGESQRELNACVAYLKGTKGKRLTITSLPTKEGNIDIMTGNQAVGAHHYTIHVTPQLTDALTMAYIIDKILEYVYTGVTDIDGGDGSSVIFSGGSGTTFLAFTDTDSTGMTCTISASGTASSTTEDDDVDAEIKVPMFFIGDSLDDWPDTTYWKTGSYLNMYRAWKSCIEYLIAKFPKAHIMITGFPMLKFDHTVYTRNNGTKDYEAFNTTDIYTKNTNFYAFLKELSAYYRIPYLAVGEECGITLDNISTYYASNNIHPMTIGYQRMGEYIARQITKYVNN